MGPFVRSVINGMGFGLGFLIMMGTAVFAVTVSGTVNSFVSGETVSAASINENFTSLKTALESIPDWTKSGSDATFTAGNVGIGTASPTSTLDVTGNAAITGTASIGAWNEQSLTHPGYIKTGSVIIQWGSGLCSTTGNAITFATPFPSTTFSIAGNPTNQVLNVDMQLVGISSSQFTCTVESGTPVVSYIAVGF